MIDRSKTVEFEIVTHVQSLRGNPSRWFPRADENLTCVASSGNQQGYWRINVFNSASQQVGILPKMMANGGKFSEYLYSFLREHRKNTCIAYVTHEKEISPVWVNHDFTVQCVLSLKGIPESVTRAKDRLTNQPLVIFQMSFPNNYDCSQPEIRHALTQEYTPPYRSKINRLHY